MDLDFAEEVSLRRADKLTLSYCGVGPGTVCNGSVQERRGCYVKNPEKWPQTNTQNNFEKIIDEGTIFVYEQYGEPGSDNENEPT